jgi:hypothetical protein
MWESREYIRKMCGIGIIISKLKANRASLRSFSSYLIDDGIFCIQSIFYYIFFLTQAKQTSRQENNSDIIFKVNLHIIL